MVGLSYFAVVHGLSIPAWAEENPHNVEPVSQVLEEDFVRINDQFMAIFAPIVAQYGANLTLQASWSDPLEHAGATKSGSEWIILVFGGLARDPMMTRDGYWMTLCHELGHLLGGYPMGNSKLAYEGQADYFASQVCARTLWINDATENASIATSVEAKIIDRCHEAWAAEADRNLCARIFKAGQSFVDSLAAGPNQASYDRRDTSVVKLTEGGHPGSQCRLDTYAAGALCAKSWDFSRIPGLDHLGDPAAMEEEAALYSCFEGGGARPACWFRSHF